MTIFMEKLTDQMLVQFPSPCVQVPPPSMAGGSVNQNLPERTMTRSMLPSDSEVKGFLLFGILL